MGETVVVTGRGGTGKSVIAANVSVALSGLGKKVVLIDCDFGMRSLDLIFEKEENTVYNCYDAVTEKCSLKDATTRHESGLKIMFAPNNMGIDEIDFEKFSNFINTLKSGCDYVILDCTATISKNLEKIIAMADISIVVCTCDYKSARVGDRLAQIAENNKVSKNYLIVNKLNVDTGRKNGIINSEDVFNIVALPPIGMCPFDAQLSDGRIVTDNKKAKSGKAFSNIALRLTGEKVPVMYVKKGILH